jgi:signal transduction histidine kinase
MLNEVLTDALRCIPASDLHRVTRSTSRPVAAVLPRRALAQALANLVRNALAATAQDGHVAIEADARNGTATFVVRDDGPGLPPEVRSRCGEPFVTTKPAGSGTGLGIYLTRTFAETLGGRLVLESPPGKGVTATLQLPRAVAPTPRERRGKA